MNNGQDMPMAEAPQVERVSEPKEWRPSNAEALREFEIRIKFLNRGCIVSVGCKEIAFEDYTNAMAAINNYVANPWDEQQKWRKILD
jgi:hypothetical protein